MSRRSFSRYDIVEALGSGGMGVVYHATDRRLGRSVALKFLSAGAAAEGEVRERFLREARAASSLDHPHIGTIYGIEEAEDGELCIVMAFYEGETLAARLKSGPLDSREAVRIAAEIASGVAEAHSRGIIHRDIKPSNIFLTKAGPAKLLDFGLVKFATGHLKLTQPDIVMGTAGYMSPEQARGEDVDCRTDVWSLGAVLYEALAGDAPFTGNNLPSVLYAIVHEQPARLRRGTPAIKRVVLKALQKDPAQRHPSMTEFARELQAAATQSTDAFDEELRTATLSWPRSPQRVRKRVYAGAAAAVLLAGTFVIPEVRTRVAAAIPGMGSKVYPVTVAVLPFTSHADAEAIALAHGLTEALGLRMSRLQHPQRSLTVIPAGEISARQVKTAEEARRMLGATLAITGSLQRTPSGGLRLELQLIDSRHGAPVRLVTEESRADSGALEDLAAAQLAAALDIRANPSTIAAAERPSSVAYEHYLRGLGYLQRWDKADNLKRAIAAFGEASRIDPEFAPALVGLAEASRIRYRVDKDPAEIEHALTYGQQALRWNANLPDAHVVMGRTYQETAQRDLAINEFRKALEAEPQNAAALLGLARVYEEMGQKSEAENTYVRALDSSPYAWTHFNALANFYIRQERYGDAEVQFRRALKLTPDSHALYTNLGIVLRRQKRYAEAIEMFRRSIATNPSYQAHLNLGHLFYSQGRFRQAIESYDRALQLNNRNFRTWGTRAQAMRLSGESGEATQQAYRRAIELAEESLRVQPDQPLTRGLLGVYYACVGDRAQAEVNVSKALRTADPTVMVEVASAFAILGDQAKARDYARKAVVLGFNAADLRRDPDLRAVALEAAASN